MQENVKFSIIIPTYNYAGCLARAIKSATSQLGENDELIVIDDGSTDNTCEVLELLQKDGPSHFSFFHKKNGGPASARNLGIDKSKGDFLIFLDADDELAPRALDLLHQHIEENPATRMIVGGHTAITPEGEERIFIPSELPASSFQKVKDYLLRKKISLSNGACAMHREIFTRGVYPENFRSVEDIPVFAQALAHYPCSTLKYSIAIINKHSDSLRHQFNYTRETGLHLVEEVFSPERLGEEFNSLKQDFYVQRCLSLFRSAYLARDYDTAKYYFKNAVQHNWQTILKFGYLRKAVRVWLKV
jgi:glycosyltransferase involved in cell wall biosynthesis